MQTLPVETSVLQFNGDIDFAGDLDYGKEILVVVRARVGAPAYREMKAGLKLVHRAELIEVRVADEDLAEFEALLERDSDTPRLPFPASEDPTREIPIVSDAPVVNGGEVTLTAVMSEPRPAVRTGPDDVLSSFLQGNS